MLIISLVGAFTIVHRKLLLTVQQEIVLKLVQMAGLESTVREDVNKFVHQNNLQTFSSIYAFKNVQLTQYFMVILILMFVLNNVQQ